jgi:hypothetical protein
VNIGSTGTSSSTSTVNIATGSNNVQTVNIGSTNGASTTTLQAGSGGIVLNTGTAAFTEVAGTRTLTVQQRSSAAVGTNLTVSAGGAGTTGAAFTGGLLTLQGGAAGGTGNANGGAVTITGGVAVGTGTQGLVNLSTSAFTSSAVQTNSITAGFVDVYSTIPVTANTTGVTVSVPDPGQSVIGRVLYITARDGSNDFTLRLNAARTPIDIAMKANSTATLIWNGVNWTAAGASSSTDLQSAYNNTLTSAGGAEIVLNPTGGAADGFTIRNNGTTPINGGLLEVQSSIGTNLFSVNNYATEYATNGGAETPGGSSTTFPANTWAAGPGGGTVTRENAATTYIATGLGSVKVVTTTTANQGAKDTLGALTNGVTYQVSFTGKIQSGADFVPTIYYSGNGTSDTAQCTNTTSLNSSTWSKVTCTFVAASSSSTNAIIIRQPTGVAHTFYIDNLSVTPISLTSTPSNVQIGGGLLGGQPTLFTLDRFSTAPVAAGNDTYLGSMYYDTTTNRIQCYEADGWGACGSAPDNIITLTPEYTGAVLNGSGIGTMTADFCSNEVGVLVMPATGNICANHEVRNFYRWTSPQATDQNYSIYVNYKLPSTFKNFNDDSTIKLTARRDHATNANASLEVFRKNVNGNVVTQCGSLTNITTSGTPGSWEQASLGGTGETACGFTGGDYIIFKINVTAKSAANVYIENLDFTFMNK